VKKTCARISTIALTAVFLFVMPPHAKAFSLFNIFDTDIPDCFTLFGLTICGDSGNPYPSTGNAVGFVGTIPRATVTLKHLSYGSPDPINAQLLGGDGHPVVMSDAAGSSNIPNVMPRFNDNGVASLGSSAQITSGTFKPTGYGAEEAFDSYSQAGSYDALLFAFNGSSPTGLGGFVIPDDCFFGSRLTQDWTLEIPIEQPTGPIPEPSSLMLLGSAVLALGAWVRKRTIIQHV
jgi:hypothetical protein